MKSSRALAAMVAAARRQAPSPGEIDRRVGGRVRHLRPASGWSQEDLAARLGISRNLLMKYESGESSVIALHLHELSRMAQVSVNWFFVMAPPISPGVGRSSTIAASVAEEIASLVRCIGSLPVERKKAIMDFLSEADAGE